MREVKDNLWDKTAQVRPILPLALLSAAAVPLSKTEHCSGGFTCKAITRFTKRLTVNTNNPVPSSIFSFGLPRL